MNGVLILQSLALGTRLDVPSLMVSRVSRVAVGGVTGTQPIEWTMIDFTVDDDAANALAQSLAAALEPDGHWYADFGNGAQHTVVFPGKVFRYAVGDATARAEVETYGASIGIPRAQLDWKD